MGEVKCPTCDVIIPPKEVAEGWCENCGKKIPRFALKEKDGANVSSAATTAANSTPEVKVSGRAYAIMIGFIILGAITVVVIQRGKADLVWLGCGIGAGLGILVAQMTGNWVRSAKA